MDADAIIKTWKNEELDKVPTCSLAKDCLPPDPPGKKLTKRKLSPLTQSFYINNKQEAFSPELGNIVLQHPICVIRGLTEALEISLSLFSTKTLVETQPNQRVDMREQAKHVSDENWDAEQKKKVWKYFSHINHTTISKYARYQSKIFSNIENSSSTSDQEIKHMKDRPVKFATNVDLSSNEWKPQLKELKKLPPFLKVKSKANMLSYVGHEILGMNTVQLYMKVPGCRTPGHQENNNFCSVNINIGPGVCEWFAVPNEYWGVMNSFCEQENLSYLNESWWPPDLDVLRNNNVPVYRFHQKPGDIVWVNVGCVHWVHAIGVCNNIAWNVGPLSARQYQAALERYEWNKLQRFQSIVPMMHLSWNLARLTVVKDPELFELIKNCLMETMKYSFLTRRFLLRKSVKVIYDKNKRENMYNCEECRVEVFNLLICKKKKQNNQLFAVFCVDCALQQSPSLKGFLCFREYHTKTLMKIYKNFTLC